MQVILHIFLFFILCIIFPTSQAVEPYLGYKCDYAKGNYTQDSLFYSNLLIAFSNLTSFSSSNFFSNVTIGSNADKLYAIYDCRNDLPLQTCHDCLKDATKMIMGFCPTKEAIISYEECMLRYADRPIVSTMELTPYYYECDMSTPDGGTELNKTVAKIFQGLIDQATSNDSSQYFATGEGSYFEYQKVYCMVQCTPDLSRSDCEECLTNVLNRTLECASGNQLLSLFTGPSCQMRYSLVPFFNLSSSRSYGLPPMASPPNLSPKLRVTNDGQHLVDPSYKLCFFVFLVLLAYM